MLDTCILFIALPLLTLFFSEEDLESYLLFTSLNKTKSWGLLIFKSKFADLYAHALPYSHLVFIDPFTNT